MTQGFDTGAPNHSWASCWLGFRAFHLLAWPKELEVNLRGGDAPFEQIMINADHERLRSAEVKRDTEGELPHE